jgi:hypothetical protein
MSTAVIRYSLNVSWKRRKHVQARRPQNCSFSHRKEASVPFTSYTHSLPSKPIMCTLNCTYVWCQHGVWWKNRTLPPSSRANPQPQVRLTAAMSRKRSQSHWISYSILKFLRTSYAAWFPPNASVYMDSQGALFAVLMHRYSCVFIRIGCSTPLHVPATI